MSRIQIAREGAMYLIIDHAQGIQVRMDRGELRELLRNFLTDLNVTKIEIATSEGSRVYSLVDRQFKPALNLNYMEVPNGKKED